MKFHSYFRNSISEKHEDFRFNDLCGKKIWCVDIKTDFEGTNKISQHAANEISSNIRKTSTVNSVSGDAYNIGQELLMMNISFFPKLTGYPYTIDNGLPSIPALVPVYRIDPQEKDRPVVFSGKVYRKNFMILELGTFHCRIITAKE